MKFKVVKEEKKCLKLKDLQVGQFFRFKNMTNTQSNNVDKPYLICKDFVNESYKILSLSSMTLFDINDDLNEEIVLLEQINEMELKEV